MRPLRRRVAPSLVRLLRRTRRLPRMAGALGRLAVIEVGIRLLPLPRLAALLCTPLATGLAPAEVPATPIRLRAVERSRLLALARMAPRWPFCDGPCLRQALATGLVLRRHRPVLRIGAALEAGDVVGHAWVELPGASIGASDGFGVLLSGDSTDAVACAP